MTNLDEFLAEVHTVAIGGHVRPDGDCVGSCLAMYNYIKTYFSKVQVDLYLDPIPDVFNFLCSADLIQSDRSADKQYDLFISLDASDKERMGEAVKYFDTAKSTLCVDHHITNPGFAEKNWIVADASSTAELAFQMMEEEKISLETAEALYLGMIHDTGVFQYSNTSPATLVAASELIKFGFDFPKIIEETFYEKTFAQNQIMARALLASELCLDDKCIVSVISKELMELYGVTGKDLDGIINQMRNTKGVECAIFLYELDEFEYKVSMRSGGEVNVSAIAQFFGGGGHVRAAGCTMKGNAQDIISSLCEQVKLQYAGV